jgi:hypothetical protein
MQDYTIIGYWPDTMQRFAEFERASNPVEAEKRVFEKHNGVSICAVMSGRHQCADSYGYVRSSSG